MKTLERGFKAWAERTSVAIRKELELSVEDKLCPFKFSDYLGAKLWKPEDVPGITQEILDQLYSDPFGWSATSLRVNEKSIVIYNPNHSPGRQASDIVHELAHDLLSHQPATLIVSLELENVNMRSFDQKQEDEANCLAWTLLVPRDGLLKATLRKKTKEEIALQFGVTETLVNFRLRTTGITRQVRY